MKNRRVEEILFQSFKNNGSINFVIKQDKRKEQRLRFLLKYSIFSGEQFGKIYLSEDQKACAIILDSEKKKATLGSLFWEAKLLFKCIGFANLHKVLKRESVLKSTHPKRPFIHLWYIGVDPACQGQGIGSMLLEQILTEFKGRTIHLETSNAKNIPFYERQGFMLTVRLDELGYPLMIFQKD
jgi:ribosomal protein S18 acetylase RimI-like enzyme